MTSTQQLHSLLERDQELTQARDAVDELVRGHGGVVIVRGPAGIGKTALLDAQARHAAAAGVRTAIARASVIERTHAFGVVRQAAEQLLRDTPPDKDPFSGAAGHARAILDHPGGSDGGPEPVSEYASLHGLYWFVVGLTDAGPVHICVDDVQWADEPSLRWLAFLGHRLAGVPVLLTLTYRPEPAPAESSPALAEVLNLQPARVITPAPLTASATEQLADELLGGVLPTPVAQRFHELTTGNPYLIVELARAVHQSGSSDAAVSDDRLLELGAQALSRRMRERLATLDPDAATLARAAAVCDATDLAIAAEVAGLDVLRARDAATRLREANLLTSGPLIGFAHPLTQAAVLETMSAGELNDAHDRAATALAKAGEPERAASHLLETAPHGNARAAQTLRVAGMRAVRNGAPELAAKLLARALDEPPNAEDLPQILTELGQVELDSGQAEEAIKHLREAVDRAQHPRMIGEAAARLCRALGRTGRYRESVEVMQSTLDVLGPEEADVAERLQGRMLIDAAFIPQLWDRVAERTRSLRAQTAQTTEGARIRAAVLAMLGVYTCEPESEVIALAEEAIGSGDRFAGSGLDVDATALAVTCLLRSRRWRLAATVLDQGLEQARREARLDRVSTILNLRGQLSLIRGDLDAAEADATEQLQLDIGGIAPLIGLAALIEVLIERNQLERANQLLADRQLNGELPDVIPLNYLLHARGRLRAASGDREAGLVDLLEVGRRGMRAGDEGSVVVPWRSSAAHVMVALGRRDEARALADEELTLMRRFGAPVPLGLTLHAAARVAEDEEAFALLQEAVDVLEEADSPVVLARVLVDYATALRWRDKTAEARAAAGRAVTLADERGAIWIASRAAAELSRAGGRPRRLLRRTATRLTPQQLRVAELAASGLTNRQIAQEMFLTEKTVEGHLAGAYRTLNVSSRTDLPAALKRYQTSGGQGADQG